MNVLPLFKSHFSIGKSILTFDKPKREKYGPTSILTIAKENKLEQVPIVEDSIGGLLELQKNSADMKTRFIFGVNLFITTDMQDKSDESWKETSKVTVFMKNDAGYYNMIKILAAANCDGSVKGIGRIDYKTLAKLWKEKNLSMSVPFYDSFLFKNILVGHRCVPDFSFTKPIFFIEDNSLPFDDLMASRVTEFCSKHGYKIAKAQSIYYEKKEDFTAYLTFRCVHSRTTLDKPNLNHMCSDEFCFESWFVKNHVRQATP